MSLTSLLKGAQENQKEFQKIFKEIIPTKTEFKTFSGKEAFSKTEYEVRVSSQLCTAYQASLIGTSFDYLARIMIARVVKKNREKVCQNFVAEQGYKILQRYLAGHFEQEVKLSKRFIEIKKKFENYPKNKKHIKELVNDAVFLARLEHIFRSGMLPANYLEESFFNEAEEVIVNDLINLCEVFQIEFLDVYVKAESEVTYNPKFGCCAAFVGGADGDIIIDSVLYDFKTGKNVGYKWQDIAQLTGYYLFNQLSEAISDAAAYSEYYAAHDIKQVAFYRARFGEVEYIDIEEFNYELMKDAQVKLLKFFMKNTSIMNPILIEHYDGVEKLLEIKSL